MHGRGLPMPSRRWRPIVMTWSDPAADPMRVLPSQGRCGGGRQRDDGDSRRGAVAALAGRYLCTLGQGNGGKRPHDRDSHHHRDAHGAGHSLRDSPVGLGYVPGGMAYPPTQHLRARPGAGPRPAPTASMPSTAAWPADHGCDRAAAARGVEAVPRLPRRTGNAFARERRATRPAGGDRRTARPVRGPAPCKRRAPRRRAARGHCRRRATGTDPEPSAY